MNRKFFKNLQKTNKQKSYAVQDYSKFRTR